MNRSSFAFFVALLIHLLIFLIIYILIKQVPHKTFHKPKENKVKISLKQFKPKPKTINTTGNLNKKTKPSIIAPPLPKGGQLKKIVKAKPLIKYKKKVTKQNPKPLPKTKKEPNLTKTPSSENLFPYKEEKEKPKIVKKEENKTKPKKENSLYSLLSQDVSDQEEKEQKSKSTYSNAIEQDIKKLYGAEFGKLTPGQQKYILDNQEIMRRITQQVLNRVARVNIPYNLRVNRSNIIEFYLHPDGSMSNFKFLSKSGILILDETTKETIEYAYSKYPRPKEKTLIRYKVFYHLAGY